MHESPEIVNTTFVSMYGDGKGMTRSEKLTKWNEAAKKLAATTYKGQIALEQRAKEAHAEEVKVWSVELEGIEEAKDVHGYVSA